MYSQREKSITDRVAYSLFIVGIPHAALFLHFGLLKASFGVVLLYVVAFCTLALNQFLFAKTAKFVLILGVSSSVFFFSILLGPTSSASSVFFPLIALALVLFHPKQRLCIGVGAMIPVVLRFFLDLNRHFLFVDVSRFSVPVPSSIAFLVQELFVFTAFLYSFYFVFLFYHAAFGYEEKLELSNLELQNSNGILSRVLEKQKSSDAFGKKIAQKLVQTSWPIHSDFVVDCVYAQSYSGSGDFVYMKEFEEGKYCFLLADVAGHGLQASIMMSALTYLVESELDFSKSPKELMFLLNNHVCRSLVIQKHVPMLLGFLDIHARTVLYTNAGYQDGFFKTGDDLKSLKIGGIGLGFYENETFDEELLILSKDAVLCIFSNGLVEGRNRFSEPFGMRRVSQSFMTHTLSKTDTISKKMFEDFQMFLADHPQVDDVVVFSIKMLK